MKDDRNRVAIDAPYASAVGLAAYCFATCEWNAVWCAEKLKPGYIHTIEAKRKTAGVIASDLINLVNSVGDPTLKARLTAPAAEFQRLTSERNGLLHGNPATAANGDQRLFRHGAEWTIAAVDNFADQVTACLIELNDILHKHLP